jgi:hypothetical protein
MALNNEKPHDVLYEIVTMIRKGGYHYLLRKNEINLELFNDAYQLHHLHINWQDDSKNEFEGQMR